MYTPAMAPPGSIFALLINNVQAIGPHGNRIEATIVLNGVKELGVKELNTFDRFFVWNWISGLTFNFTCSNSISMKDDKCAKCEYKLTKQEKTLIMLHNLGRQLDGH